MGYNQNEEYKSSVFEYQLTEDETQIQNEYQRINEINLAKVIAMKKEGRLG